MPVDEDGEPIPVKKRRGAKAPNPLSVKKKVVKAPLEKKEKPRAEVGSKRKRMDDGEDDGEEEGETSGSKKRRRRRAGPRAVDSGGGGDGSDGGSD